MQSTLSEHSRGVLENMLAAKGASAAQIRDWQRLFDACEEGDAPGMLSEELLAEWLTSWEARREPVASEDDWELYYRDYLARAQPLVETGQWTPGRRDEEAKSFRLAFESMLGPWSPVPSLFENPILQRPIS
ncbi:MAG: hypothetical protein ABSA13_19340 [Beijerinckiaceae bacterium]